MVAAIIQFDKGQLLRLENAFAGFPKVIPRIMRNSLNKTAVTLRKEAVKKIAEITGLLQRDVRRFAFIDRATLRHLIAKIRFSAYGIPFGWFKSEPSGKGLLASRTGEFQHGGFLIRSSRVKEPLAFRREGRARKPLEFIRSGKTLADYYFLIKNITEERGGQILKHHFDMQILWAIEKQMGIV